MMSVEVLMAVTVGIAVFRVVTACSMFDIYQHFGGTAASIVRVEDTGSRFRNVGKYLTEYTVPHPRS
jgi:hypothetical protein